MDSSSQRILIVDDEEDIRWALDKLMRGNGFETVAAATGEEALQHIGQSQPDLVLLDMVLPDANGRTIAEAAQTCGIPVIVITGNGNMRDAVKMVKSGVHDYLTKPFDNDYVMLTVRRALEGLKLKREVLRLREEVHENAPLCETMGNSKSIQHINSQVSHVARTDFSVLVMGSTGTGKELVAQAIHAYSPRSDKPFIAVDCGAIPEALMEGELFGHERGAYTGADRIMVGAVERASGGTLFLDEIGNMPVAMQSKMLRVLETKKIRRLGSTKEIRIDFRVVAATNENLIEKVDRNDFRRDLYHRLAEFTIHIPPLAERGEDLPYLVRRILTITNQELQKNVRGLSSHAWELIQKHPWPGNVRELKNVLRRAVLLCTDGEIISSSHLGLEKEASPDPAYDPDDAAMEGITLRSEVQRAVTDVERKLLKRALEHAGGNKASAARLLHIDYKTIHYKLKEYGIEWKK